MKFARNETGEKGFTGKERTVLLTYVGRRFLGCCHENLSDLVCGHGWSNFFLGHASTIILMADT